MRKTLTILISLGILLAGIAFSALLWITKPEAEKEATIQNLPTAEVIPIEPRKVTFNVPSQGIVEADRRARLAAEVAGKVVKVSDKFEAGFQVEEGAELVTIDAVDYEAAVAQAEATLADAKSALAGEEARAVQAERDVQRLGSGSATDLALRKPQLASAKGKVESAKVMLEKAKTDLERTVVRAPFDAIIASTMTEIGSYLTPGMEVAEVFETSPYEVRLPLSIDEVAFLQTDSNGNPTGEVQLTTTAAGQTRTWNARIVRTEGEVDRETRSIHVVAEIESKGDSGLGPRPGLFVQAEIPSREIPNATKIPFSAFLDLDTVVVIDPDNRVRFRTVEVIHREGDDVYVTGGIEKGDRVCITELPDVVEGTEVEPRLATIDNESDATSEKPKS